MYTLPISKNDLKGLWKIAIMYLEMKQKWTCLKFILRNGF